jgi:hypothetical protein
VTSLRWMHEPLGRVRSSRVGPMIRRFVSVQQSLWSTNAVAIDRNVESFRVLRRLSAEGRDRRQKPAIVTDVFAAALGADRARRPYFKDQRANDGEQDMLDQDRTPEPPATSQGARRNPVGRVVRLCVSGASGRPGRAWRAAWSQCIDGRGQGRWQASGDVRMIGIARQLVGLLRACRIAESVSVLVR